MDTGLKIRRSLTPSVGIRATRDMRRELRREVSERVELRGRDGTSEGWTLNLSRGGVRVIVERPVSLGEVFDLTIGLAAGSPLVRQGRVVWFQQEADGFIVGMQFVPTGGVQ